MAEETLKLNLDRAFDPGPDFPNRLLLSRTITMLGAEADQPRGTRPLTRRAFPRAAMHVVAATVIVAVAVAAIAAFLATHHPVGPVPVHAPPGPRLVAIPNFTIQGPGVGVCQSACGLGSPLFVSPNVGWLAENLTPDTTDTADCSPGCAATVVLFRTDDGGLHWNARVSWIGWAQQILATPNGREVTVVGAPDTPGAGLLHSTDGGTHWSTFGYPPSEGQAVQKNCKFGTPACVQLNLTAQVDFVSSREGWVFSQEATYAIVDLFHTTDSGATWSLTRVDTKAAFNVDIAKGTTDSVGNVDHQLQGRLVFGNSSTAWFVPDIGAEVFVTHDGGGTWRAQTLAMPAGVSGRRTAVTNSVRLFSNGKDGVISVYEQKAGSATSRVGYDSNPYQFEYTTTDGGDNWSKPTHTPAVEMPFKVGAPTGTYFVDVILDFVDATHWVGLPMGPWDGPQPLAGFMRTNDAGQHWDILPATKFQGSGIFDFVDILRGWAYASESSGLSLFRTADGGVTWTPVNLPKLG